MNTRHIILISGKDSAATAIVQTTRQPDLPYEYVFNETGAETPEIYEWLDKIESYLDRPIVRYGANLEAIINDQGMLPSPRVRFCTRLSKIEPMERMLEGVPALIYFGLRADEMQRIGYVARNNKTRITPIYPLRELGLGLADVWQLLEQRDLLPPQFFWKNIYDRVVAQLGDAATLIDRLPIWKRNQLFAWRSRPNCYFCFFQRQYEFIGLLEHHPDLFWHAVEIEENTGADDYTIRQDYSLRQLATKAEEIKEKRVKQIVKLLWSSAQRTLFNDEEPSILDVTSCGLLCGK